jgi:hypothetical protein
VCCQARRQMHLVNSRTAGAWATTTSYGTQETKSAEPFHATAVDMSGDNDIVIQRRLLTPARIALRPRAGVVQLTSAEPRLGDAVPQVTGMAERPSASNAGAFSSRSAL